jgi:type IV secretory pathway ATPase VirB11/archaellum biosynthesis ATPase
VFCKSLCVLSYFFLLSSLLQFTDSDYHFGTIELFLILDRPQNEWMFHTSARNAVQFNFNKMLKDRENILIITELQYNKT